MEKKDKFVKCPFCSSEIDDTETIRKLFSSYNQQSILPAYIHDAEHILDYFRSAPRYIFRASKEKLDKKEMDKMIERYEHSLKRMSSFLEMIRETYRRPRYAEKIKLSELPQYINPIVELISHGQVMTFENLDDNFYISPSLYIDIFKIAFCESLISVSKARLPEFKVRIILVKDSLQTTFELLYEEIYNLNLDTISALTKIIESANGFIDFNPSNAKILLEWRLPVKTYG